ncbi:4-(cytidine 5'-diphospho)-2-C-methyl-D-erythritol kinase [Actimicrobium sp. CCC2.4]|uniref:4-(cytidine 5'-diphospho)-2-C-methyl-D-erythritol kinase n=1 Tax=Actimicrobium sp. CCC2.4 TaxID=3048606 RepID=UPI002AC9ACA4|nr:4-(cytidine 5'-diphospho)-2-C-methyl-D-erythritol kinase [Actimicrobium sp. CCC2.4]MEB0134282.1 4-(cytidine 5'-diphospho)-2-C-methyl-D-erythritol kinase [Actimicrobium sp. CCC2.4]WPX32928.1 4-(cytidine 5'-diphospho)-2-C-methyl-D-erythritol kinase [Actimicrobium sp. CCC2.4]
MLLKLRTLRDCPAPAKLNLFLHVTGRRADGYHLLQSAFQLIDRSDLLHFDVRDDGVIRRTTEMVGIPHDSDLIVRAARLLQQATGSRYGADIAIEKRLPMGGGLGGGSSDAATTMMALNHLWQTGMTRTAMQQLGLQLGADVPFFLFGSNAFAEGIGEQLITLDTPECWFLVLEPGVSIPTPVIFASSELTRNSKPVRMLDFSGALIGFGRNDLQAVATALFPPVAEAIKWLGGSEVARMTGSGACVFRAFTTKAEATAVLEKLPKRWSAWIAKSLNQHPLAQLQ